MKKWILFLISLVLLILDNSFMPFLAIKGAFPSLLFVFAIAYSIINGKKEAVFIGVISGLLQDIYFYEGFGVNALINMLICLLAAFIGENIYREKKLIPTISMILLYMLKVLSVFLVLKIAGKTINFQVGIYASLYSAIIMFLGYDFVLRLYDNNYKKKSWRLK
ncbi:MAG: rod shape-determining protein MreD [Clostridium sp.]|uniref:rod shape-determining protein MreD n=1 Tax=Clostridium sp. TaxID=1506 RepID=UPI0025D8A1FD|nr:rod shape-determining protein MreD [Clostridium sp.]MCI6693465.1 rod shape-determining protein MreD [Clostridium sp.]MDY4251061.1 rod shape-determining protein MreD [Clostridium sp.]